MAELLMVGMLSQMLSARKLLAGISRLLEYSVDETSLDNREVKVAILVALN